MMQAMILADDNPVIVGGVFHRSPPSSATLGERFLNKYLRLNPPGCKTIVRRTTQKYIRSPQKSCPRPWDANLGGTGPRLQYQP